MKRIAGILVLVVLAVGLALLVVNDKKTTSNSGSLKVVAAENFWGNIASQIGGNHVKVSSIITDPTADPHLYESNASNASEVSTADVVIVNGLGYDDFMQKLLNGSKNDKRQVITTADIMHVTGDDANPHLWYDIPRIHDVAETIANYYESKDPAHKADYQNNLNDFNKSLEPLIATINQIKASYSGSPVAYTEPVPGYLLADSGLTVKTPAGFSKSIEDGNDPSPVDSTAMDSLMTNKAVKMLLYNSQATSPVTERVKDLAQQSGVPVIGVTETLPPNERSYQTWQQNQLNQILKALEAR